MEQQSAHIQTSDYHVVDCSDAIKWVVTDSKHIYSRDSDETAFCVDNN